MKIQVDSIVMVNHNGYNKKGIVTKTSNKPERDRHGLNNPSVCVKFIEWSNGDCFFKSDITLI